MAKIGMHLRLSPLILPTPEYCKTCFPVSVGIPRNYSRLMSNNTRRIFSSGHNEEGLKPMWDDGYGSKTVKDYIEAAENMIKSDCGPPRWFCPTESGPPLINSPLLLYLPGIDGIGMGMMLHHKAVGKVFEVRCMHIPLDDRTAFEGLVKFVEEAVKAEHALFPKRPIYLVGDSFGACLALSVAAFNPTIDLVLILVNPATSFNRSQLQHLIPLLEAFPEQFHMVLPYLLAAILGGDPITMAKFKNNTKMLDSPAKQIEKLSSLITEISNFVENFPNQTLIWKLKLLKSAAAFANSRLHAVKCQVLILAGGKDSMLPSAQEAHRLSSLLKDSRIRIFKDNAHTLLLDDGVNLLTILKYTFMYRRSKVRDPITDYIPPSRSEFVNDFDRQFGLFRVATGPVMLSTLPDGKIVRGLEGVPDHGPILLVGYHMLLGTEIITIAEEFLREKNVMVHGLAHPHIFSKSFDKTMLNSSLFDSMKVFGAVPVTSRNLMKLLSKKACVLLYPGGIREALHRKGEAYKLFWPEEPEFVRIAVKYGAKIVPFGVVGEDDAYELVFDYDDLKMIPPAKEMIERENEKMAKVREGREVKGEVSNQDFFIPGFYPKLPGRFYFLFGKAIETKGKGEVVKDKMKAKELYLQIKSEVERNMEYLMRKREEDPYRRLFDRLLYNLVSAPVHEIPTFDP